MSDFNPYAYNNPTEDDTVVTYAPTGAPNYPIAWLIEAYEAEDSQAQPISGDATTKRRAL